MLYSYSPTLPNAPVDVTLANGIAKALLEPRWSECDPEDYVVLNSPGADWTGVVLPEKLTADVYQVTEGRRFQRTFLGIVRCRAVRGFLGVRGAVKVDAQPSVGRLLGTVVGPMHLNMEAEFWQPEDEYWEGLHWEKEGLLERAKDCYMNLVSPSDWSEHRYMALRRLAAMCCDSREESQRLWLEAIRLCPLRREAYIELAENYELNKELHLARVMGEAALRCEDKDQVGWIIDTESKLRAHDTMSIILSRMGDYRGAMHHGRIAVELGEQRIRNNLAYWRRKLDEGLSAPAPTPDGAPSSSQQTDQSG